MNLSTEIWIGIPGWIGLYEASNFGRIRSLYRETRHWTGAVQPRNGRILRQCPGRHGYLYVTLCRDKFRKSFHVARLVLMAFKPTSDDSLEPNHKWGDKSDNRLSELDWMPREGNVRHAYRLGLNPSGEDHAYYKHGLSCDPTLYKRLWKRADRRGVDVSVVIDEFKQGKIKFRRDAIPDSQRSTCRMSFK